MASCNSTIVTQDTDINTAFFQRTTNPLMALNDCMVLGSHYSLRCLQMPLKSSCPPPWHSISWGHHQVINQWHRSLQSTYQHWSQALLQPGATTCTINANMASGGVIDHWSFQEVQSRKLTFFHFESLACCPEIEQFLSLVACSGVESASA